MPGLLFMLGMLVTDGVNGLWISRLICRADQLALIASRVMSLGTVRGSNRPVAGIYPCCSTDSKAAVVVRQSSELIGWFVPQ